MLFPFRPIRFCNELKIKSYFFLMCLDHTLLIKTILLFSINSKLFQCNVQSTIFFTTTSSKRLICFNILRVMKLVVVLISLQDHHVKIINNQN